MRDLRTRGAGDREQRRLAGVGETDQPDVGDQFELEPQPAGFARLAELGETRGLSGGRLEAGIAAAAPPGARDHQPLPVRDQVGQGLALLVFDQRSRWNLQHDIGRVLAMAPAAAAPPAAASGEVVLEAIVLQRVELARYFEHNIAAAAAVSPVGASARHELLAPEAQLPGPAIAGLDEDLDPVSEHQKNRRLNKRPPVWKGERVKRPGGRGLNGFGQDRDFLTPVTGALEANDPIDQSKERVVAPHPDVGPRKDRRPSLAKQDRAGIDRLARSRLHAQPLANAIASVS